MPSKYAIIFVIIMVVMNVLGGIMKKRAEKQKLAKLSNSRSQRSSPETQASRSVLASSASSSRVSLAMDRAEQLTARRKAQLDELRSRRQQRKTGIQLPQQQSQVRIGQPSTAFRSVPTHIPQPKPTPVKPQQQRVVIRPSVKPKKQAPIRSSMKDHSQHERADTQRLHGLREGLGASVEKVATEPMRISPAISILDTGELTPEILRRMVVLKEIFDRPVALRDSEIWDRL